MNPGQEAISNWQEIYSNFFNLDLDFSHLRIINSYDPNKHVVIVVSRKISLHDVLREIEEQYGLEVEGGYYPNAELGSKWSFIKNQRSNNDYLIIVAKTHKPSVTFNSNSFYDWLERESPNGRANYSKSVNLLERLLLELYVYYHEGFHLDVDTHCSNKTVCVSPTFKNNKYNVYPAVGCDKNGGIYITQYEGSIGFKEQNIMNGTNYSYDDFRNGNGGRTVLFTYGRRDCLM